VGWNDDPVWKKRKSDIGTMSNSMAEAGVSAKKHRCFVIGSLKPKTGLKIAVDVLKGEVPAARDTRG
jgi:hypothetical protein